MNVDDMIAKLRQTVGSVRRRGSSSFPPPSTERNRLKVSWDLSGLRTRWFLVPICVPRDHFKLLRQHRRNGWPPSRILSTILTIYLSEQEEYLQSPETPNDAANTAPTQEKSE